MNIGNVHYVPHHTQRVIDMPVGTVFGNEGRTDLLKKLEEPRGEFLTGHHTGKMTDTYYGPNDVRVVYKKEQDMLANIRQFAEKYERYIVMAAVLLIIDHFILKGVMRERVTKLATAVADRCAKVLDSAISTIGGE